MDFLDLELWKQIVRGIILGALLISGLFISIIDFKKRIIPNSLVVLWLVLGVVNLFTLGSYEEMIFPAICFGIFFVLGIVLFFLLGENKIGGGDAKLMMTLGAFMITMSHVFMFAIVSFVTALIVFIIAKVKGIKSVPAGPVYSFSSIVPFAFCSFPWYVGVATTLIFLSVFLTSSFVLYKKDKIEPFEMVS